MRRLKKYLFLLIVIIPCAAFSAVDSDCKLMRRVEDPIVVEGKHLERMLGTNPDEFSLMAYRKGAYHSIPFQVDQRHPDGRYAYTFGKDASKDSDPFFDENDELAFMVNDFGEKAPDGKLPKGAAQGMEIELNDPVDHSRGWVYIFRFQSDISVSDIDYIRFGEDRSEKRFQVLSRTPSGNGYIIGGRTDSCVIDEGRLRFKDGRVTADLLDRMKIRGRLKVKFMFPFDLFLDSSLKEELVGWIDGPIRVIRNGKGYVKLAALSVPLNTESLTIYYRNHMDWKMDVGLPFKMKTMIRDFPIKATLDFNENIMGARVYTETNPISANLVLDGKREKEVESLDYKSYCNWITGFIDNGGLIFRLFLSEDCSNVDLKLCLNENLENENAPEDHPGEIAIGVDVKGMENIDSSHIGFNAKFFLLPGFKPGEEKQIIRIHDDPVTMKFVNKV